MTASQALSQSSPNRRIAARIYEPSNLFYRKLEPGRPEPGSAGFDELLQAPTTAPQALPASQSQEQDTLNVNISASGLAFTSQEVLKPGDYLMLRILLLSSLTSIMTTCRVVYCKPSNPFETDRYPYRIGAEFVNLTSEDAELLERHVQRKRNRHLVWNIAWLSLIAAILLYPLEALHLLLELGHHILELILEGLHLVFEYTEMGLDHLIEHLFHTEMHATQVIVFYLLVSIALASLYFIGRKLPAVYRRWLDRQRLFWSRKHSSARYYWHQQSPTHQAKIIGLSVAALSGYLYFLL